MNLLRMKNTYINMDRVADVTYTAAGVDSPTSTERIVFYAERGDIIFELRNDPELIAKVLQWLDYNGEDAMGQYTPDPVLNDHGDYSDDDLPF